MPDTECLRCGRPARFRDAINTPFCGPCAKHQETAEPDTLPMTPIDEAVGEG
jgi:hypothetical protein